MPILTFTKYILQITWQPYTTQVLDALPGECRMGSEIWLARCPLICFDIVEWHYPDRVLRQFGGVQGVPGPTELRNELEKIHNKDRRGKAATNWRIEHYNYIAQWDNRENMIVNYQQSDGNDVVAANYAHWYRQITRRFVSSRKKYETNAYHPRVHRQQMMVTCLNILSYTSIVIFPYIRLTSHSFLFCRLNLCMLRTLTLTVLTWCAVYARLLCGRWEISTTRSNKVKVHHQTLHRTHLTPSTTHTKRTNGHNRRK